MITLYRPAKIVVATGRTNCRLSLDDSTRDMRTEEAGGGFYHSELWQRDFPKIQLRTIADLLADRGFDLPPRQPMYRPAERVRPPEGEQGALEELAGD